MALDYGIVTAALLAAMTSVLHPESIDRTRVWALILSLITAILVFKFAANSHHPFAELPVMGLAAAFLVRALIVFIMRSRFEPPGVRWVLVTDQFRTLAYLFVCYEGALLISRI